MQKSSQTASHESAIATPTGHKTTTIAWVIFFSGILYYCFAYLLRVYPSVMEPHLLGYFHITASSFGILTAFYYFAYAPMQLPVGVSVDKVGPRRSLIAACIISTTGTLLFASSTHLPVALLGRFMIGLGSAFAYVTALKLATIWLPRQYFATATGAVTGLGMVAAIFTDMGLTHMITSVGFAATVRFPIYFGLGLLVIIFLFIRDKPKQSSNENENQEEASALSFKQLGEFLKTIVKNPQMWLIGAVGALLYLPSSVFLDTWAIPYLKGVDHFSAQQAALGASIMLGGWICSSFLSGALSDLTGSRKIPLLAATACATIISSILLFDIHLAHWMIFTLLFLFGFACGPHPLCFTLSKENYSLHISGTAISFANFLIMMGGFVFQPVVGKLLDIGWTGQSAHGIRIYSQMDYVHAIAIIPIGLALAFVLTLFIKETYQKRD